MRDFIITVSFAVLFLCVLCGFSNALDIDSDTEWAAGGKSDSTININAELKLSFGSVWWLNSQTINLNSNGTLVFNNDTVPDNKQGLGINRANDTGNSYFYFDGGTIRVDKTPGYTDNNVMIATGSGDVQTYLKSGGLTVDVASGKRGSIIAHINDVTSGTTGTLTKTGEGTLILYRPAYTTETILQGGTLEIKADKSGYLTGGVTMKGGTLQNSSSWESGEQTLSDTYLLILFPPGRTRFMVISRPPQRV